MSFKSKKITFVGGGNMARSLISGLIKHGMPNENIQVIVPDSERATSLAEDFQIRTQPKADNRILNVDIILFAVKPQILKPVCKDIAKFLNNSSAIVLSIAAGIKTDNIRQWLNKSDSNSIKIIRAMPNTPALIGLGATGLFGAGELDEAETAYIESVFNAVGISIWVNSESDLDTVTALSGSGPAYLFSLFEHLISAGVEHGLSVDQAFQLVTQTAVGAAQMAKTAQKNNIKTLRNNVTSKGGTTEAGLNVLAEHNFEHIIKKVISAAKNRSLELSKDFS